ncbi:DUF5979 domain-containing protein [Demequina flava]|uniref:DUF5979 domain-containing protein n=1 Tax=Demequina flava TaxID=1095025 RepID=UPI00128CC5FC|nr:DUF5979 domain-containing protein [Demequina flava]
MRKTLATALVGLMATTGVVTMATTAAADPEPANVSLVKTGPTDPVVPGETFNYTITVQCSYPVLNSGCFDAQVVDVVPAPFEVAGDPIVTSTGNSITASHDTGANSATVEFMTDFTSADGGSGMLGGTTATISIPVTVPDDVSFDDAETPITNTATIFASNPDTSDASGSADVTIEVPLELDTSTTKSFDPAEDIATPGTETTISIDSTNNSNGGAESMVVSDPVDPSASPNPFDSLQLSSITLTDIPAGADTAQVEVYVNGAWVPVGSAIDVSGGGPITVDLTGVTAEDVRGVRVTYSDDGTAPLIAADATSSIDVGVTQRDLGDVDGDVVVANDASTEVNRDDDSASSTGDADYTIHTNVPEVAADKSFDPNQVLHGDSSTATISAGVSGDLPVESLTVTEPSNGDFSAAMSFESIGAVTWPAGADEASITYTTTNGTEGAFSFADGAIPQAPSDPDAVLSFEIVFTDTDGSGITSDSDASFSFDVGTDPEDTAAQTPLVNEATVEGETEQGATDTATDDDTLFAYDKHLDPTAGKSIAPSQILGRDGEWAVLELSGGTAPAPVDGNTDDPYSSTNADEIVVQDPAPVPGSGSDAPDPNDEFWTYFHPSEITNVSVPADASLTIEYWDGTQWVELAGPFQGPQTVNVPIDGDPAPEDVGGLRFNYEYTGTDPDGGFPPGTTVQPNVVMNFDPSNVDPADWPLTIENCSGAAASTDEGVESGDSDPACAEIEVLEPNTGGGPSITKNIAQETIPARSHDRANVNLHWSTGGESGVESFTLTDESDPPGALTGSFYDAFDLVAIGEITTTNDPLIAYDAVDAVLIHNGTDWVVPQNSPCGDLEDNGAHEDDCAGGMDRINLTAAERATTVGVQIVFVEYTDARGAADAPPIGSGVARSIDPRPVSLVFELRDWTRSTYVDADNPGDPVTGYDLYNTADAGIVRNSATGVADYIDTSIPDAESSNSDIIDILDVDLGVTGSKTWDGGPVGIPPENTDLTAYPKTRITLSATNDSGEAFVDSMTIEDIPVHPAADDSEILMGDVFNILAIDQVTWPAGATEAEVVRYDIDGDPIDVVFGTVLDPLVIYPDDVPSWTATDLANTTGFSITFKGRIEPQAVGGISALLQLRETDRFRNDQALADNEQFYNGATANNDGVVSVEDAARNPATEDTPTEAVEDDVLLETFDIGIVVDKTFGANATDQGPEYTETEPAREEFLMTLSAQPTLGARPNSMTVIDVDPSFWNAYEFVRFDDSFSLEQPIEQVQVYACSGTTFTGALNGALTSGGCDADALLADAFAAGPAGATPELPAGLAPTDVQGLALVFSSTDAWEDPWNPLQEIPIVVQRRETMLTGDAPPTDLDGNLPAPAENGPEAAAGHWENTVEGTIAAAITSGGQVTEDADPTTADVIYAHSLTSVAVEKSPHDSALAAAGVTEFSLTFINDGDTPIFNPVFTDTLPVDGDGDPILLINPLPETNGESPYSFTLDSSAGDPLPAPWTELPVSTDDGLVIVEDPEGAPTEITFSFPDGSALSVGESYTITISMVTQAGYPANTNFTNTATVEGDRPIDTCNSTDTGGTATECSTDATNSVASGGAIRSGKFVKADDDSLGVISTVAGTECAPGTGTLTAGFYGPPCAPLTAPGDYETWRLVLQNSGNVPLSQLVAIDRLPTPGDTTVVGDLDRGSQWTPILTDPELSSQWLEADGTPVTVSGASIEVFATTDADICDDDLTPGGVTCLPADWQPVADFGGDYSSVTALKVVATFPEDNPMLPTQVVSVDAQSITPAYPETAGVENPIAYNSVATGATTAEDNPQDIVPTEGNKVGIALATGPMSFVKETTGDGADQYAPETFEVTVVCTSLGEEIYRDTVTVSANTPYEVDNLPVGSECTMEEGNNGQWTSMADTAVVVPESEASSNGSPVVTLTNDYPLASLDVSKFVIGTQGGGQADPSDAGPFGMFVSCFAFDGTPVQADDDGTATPMVFFLRHDETKTLTGLPAGATCNVQEWATASAAATDVSWETDLVAEMSASGTETDDFVLTPDAAQGETTNSVEFTNQYEMGSLLLTKQVEGPGADEHTAGPFEFHVVCVYPRTGQPDVVTFDGDVTLSGDPLEATIPAIPVGSVCDIEETGTGGADIIWIDGQMTTTAEVTVTTADTPVEVVALNRFETPTELVVEKIVDGPILNPEGDVPDIAPVTVDVVCTYAEGTPFEREITAAEFADGDPMEFELAHGETMTLTELPTGTECVVTETDQAGASSTTVIAQPAHSQPGPAADGTETSITLNDAGLFSKNEVTFTNIYPVGSLDLTKELTGDGAVERGDGPFVLHVQCYSDAYGVVSYEGDVTLGGDEPLTATITNILAPSTCEVTETEDGGADSVFFTPGTPDVKSATVDIVEDGDQAAATVTVENHFEAFASIDVTKTVDPVVTDADGNVPDLGPYLVWVRCTYDEGGPDEHTVYADGHGPLRPMVALLNDGESVSFTDIPATSTCTVTEVDTADAAGTLVTTATADVVETTADGVAGTVVLTTDNPDTTNMVGFTNVYDVGSLDLVKELVGDGVDDASGPYVFDVLCTWEREDRDPVVTWDGTLTLSEEAGMTATIDGIAAGSECLVTETDNGGADDTRLTPAGDADNEARVTIAAASSVTVTAYNQFDAPPVLPITGYESWWAAVTALAVLLAGVFLVLIARRRRS